LTKVKALNEIAEARSQSLAQMAIAWNLHNAAVTSCLIGASRVEQIEDSVAALAKLDFSASELAAIETILG
jgi:L-glyceraldehyde 3-phosphate reductase